MIKKIFLLGIFVCLFSSTFGQSIEKNWEFTSITEQSKDSLFDVNPKTDTFSLTDGGYLLTIGAKDSLESSGDYIFQNNLLVLFQVKPEESTIRYRVTEVTDSTMVLTENGIVYRLSEVKSNDGLIVSMEKKMIGSEGFTFTSLWRGALGMFSLLLLAFLFSSNRRNIRWKTIGVGLTAQLILAIGVLKVPFIQSGFELVGKVFVKILQFTQAGSEFLLGGMMNIDSFGFIFLFQVLPTIIFFSALTSVLFYLGFIQVVVKGMAWVLTRLMGISGAESLSVAGNIFLGQTEAPLMIKAYLDKMSKSEMLLVMVGGMATVAGGVLAAYIGFLGGEDEALKIFYAKHLLTASVMAAPGAIVIAKMLYPETQKITNELEVSQDKIGSNILDAIANGTTEGLKLAANVGAMLLVFIAFIAMINYGFEKLGAVTTINTWIAASTPYDKLSLEFILGYIFAPLMWLIGVAKEDMALMGQLLGIKLVASEFVGYIQLSELKNTANLISLNYEKSVIMATYMLCGFANFASIGIQIGGIGSIAPTQRKTLSEFGMKALIGGTIASLLSATIAGMIIG